MTDRYNIAIIKGSMLIVN